MNPRHIKRTLSPWVSYLYIQHPCYRDITVHGGSRDLMADEEGQASPGMTTTKRGRLGSGFASRSEIVAARMQPVRDTLSYKAWYS